MLIIMSCMRTISVKYPTISKSVKIAGKVFVLETIRDLDEAIDLLCASMSPDEQLDPFAEDLCPYFGILWPSAVGLATYLGENPALVKGKRVLELGSGLGLPSLVASYLGGDVLTTDFHPDVEEYFMRNCRHSSIQGHYQRLNWRENLAVSEKFDVVIGSDVLYESRHAKEVARGLLKFVNPDGMILLSDPGRNYLQQFVSAMNEEGFIEEMSSIKAGDQDIWILKFKL